MGTVANFKDQYQTDYSKTYRDEEILLVPLLRKRQDAIGQIRSILGDPVISVHPQTGVESRKTAVVMVANEGVIDLVMNLLCSCRAAQIDTSNYVIFVGSESDVKVINGMGVHAIYNPSLGSMPKTAAYNYGDGTFSRMMWLKVSAVYVANAAGYNVLFQDADLVWFKDPVPYMETLYGDDTDILFMDDGGRTPRFTPLYVNSGFYWMKYNSRTVYLMEKMLKSVSEISTTHSHQATLIRHIVESHEIVGLEIKMVDQRLFPSGYMYHHEKKYIASLKEYGVFPYVFHMCWTDNRDQKVLAFVCVSCLLFPLLYAACTVYTIHLCLSTCAYQPVLINLCLSTCAYQPVLINLCLYVYLYRYRLITLRSLVCGICRMRHLLTI